MKNTRSCAAAGSILIAAVLGLGLATSSRAQAETPRRTDNGKTLVVPAEQAAKGTVYYVVPGKPGANADQTRFTNTPPNKKHAKSIAAFTGFSNATVGYVVASSGDPQRLVAGEFILPVDSLDTGIRLRNKHLGKKLWLDKESHPDIHFSLKGVRGLKPADSGAGADSSTGVIFGQMTIHGVTKDFSFPATISVRPADNLIAIRTHYAVPLADFDVSNGIIGNKVANKIVVEQFLILSTEKPS